MSAYVPVRHATDAWATGRPMKKETKQSRTMTLGRQWEDPASDDSLPHAASIHSSFSSDSEFGSYKLAPFNSLAPRPTLRYEAGSRWTSSRASVPATSGSQKRAMSEKERIPEETLKAHKRIHDLADDFDASDLRELMERDQRRRDRKREKDQQRMQRRLAEKAEQHRQEGEEARKSGTPPPENLERGVMGRELVGLGIDPASAVVTSSKHRSSDVDEEAPQDEETSSAHPLETFHRTDTIPRDEPSRPAKEDLPPPESSILAEEEPISALPQGTVLGLLRSKKSRSRSTLGSDKDKNISPPPGTIEEEISRKDSTTSTKLNRFSLSSFLRRSGRNRRDSGPSSFSNTSREEMQAAAIAQAQALQAQVQAQAHAQAQEGSSAGLAAQSQSWEPELRNPSQSNPEALAKLQGQDVSPVEPIAAVNYLSRKPSSGVPKRTRSRFREDLPDFPLSPPDSRVHSPEAEPILPSVTEDNPATMQTRPISAAARYSTPTSGHISIEAMRQTPTPTDRTFGAPSPAHQSISLASIDSEGSWLSGVMISSRRASAMRDSIVRSTRRGQGHSSDSPASSTQEDLAITDDEYLSRLAPPRNSGMLHAGRRSGEGRPSSDEDDYVDESSLKWGAVGRRPNVVTSDGHDRENMRSQQGMLNTDSADEDEIDSPVSPTMDDMGPVQRARSVHVGKGHARNFSAGSAKLLDLTPRQSLDNKMGSLERRASSFDVVR